MVKYRLFSVLLMISGATFIGMSFGGGLWSRVESAARPIPTAALASLPAPETEARPTLAPAQLAAPFIPPTYPLPAPTPQAVTAGVPVHLDIPSLGLQVPIVPVTPTVQVVDGHTVEVWPVPDFKAAGWMVGSARPGTGGNTVLNGHNASRGEVFRYLYRLEKGAQIWITDERGEVYVYRVSEMVLVPERDATLAERLEHARYTLPTADERLTLITCHPYGSTRFRLIVIARPDKGLCTQGCS